MYRFLSYVDLLGTTYSSPSLATGYGNHLAQPLLRRALERLGPEGYKNLEEDEARKIIQSAMKVLFYRDARALNKVRTRGVDACEAPKVDLLFSQFQIATVTKEGVKVSEPMSAPTEVRSPLPTYVPLLTSFSVSQWGFAEGLRGCEFYASLSSFHCADLILQKTGTPTRRYRCGEGSQLYLIRICFDAARCERMLSALRFAACCRARAMYRLLSGLRFAACRLRESDVQHGPLQSILQPLGSPFTRRSSRQTSVACPRSRNAQKQAPSLLSCYETVSFPHNKQREARRTNRERSAQSR